MFETDKSAIPRDIPFRDEIERSFGGGHSLGDVQALSGPGIASTASDLGAIAFTQGNVMGFAQEPTLHDAAHEAAHVFQQRAGLPLFEGFADHEAHADAVADRVVAGQSAGDLLPSGGTASTAVQCKKESGNGAAPTAPQPTPSDGLHAADPKVVAALEARMKQANDLQSAIEIGQWGASLLPGLSPAWAKTAEAMAAAANAKLAEQRNSIIKDTIDAYGIKTYAADIIRYGGKLPSGDAGITYAVGESPSKNEKDKTAIHIGDAAFHGPDGDKPNSVAYLASVIDHEFYHASEQMDADGNWEHKPGKNHKLDALDEFTAYNNEVKNADIYGLSDAEKYSAQINRNTKYFELGTALQQKYPVDLFKYKNPRQ